MVKNTVRNTINNNSLIGKGHAVILGLSGGPDSLCLFQCLLELKEEMDFSLCAVHVNHRFRPGAAEEDQEFVEALCAREGIKCYSFEVDCNQVSKDRHLSPEDAGRQVRYESFGSVADALVSRAGLAPDRIRIAVAQNADDQCETMLLRLMRGTGPDGLVGIEYFRMQEDYMVIRPLLDVKRSDIEAFIEERGLDPRRDATNDKPIYTRNRIRLELIPYIKENFNANFEDALLRLQMLLAQDKDFIYATLYDEIAAHSGNASGVTDDISMTHSGGIEIKLEYFNSLHDAIRSRMLMLFLDSLGLTQGVSMSHIKGILEIAEKGDTSLMINLPLGYTARISYGRLILEVSGSATRKAGKTSSDSPESRKGATEGEAVKNSRVSCRIVSRSSNNRSRNIARFDADKLAADFGSGFVDLLECRSRNSGDTIGLKIGSKKIQDIFVDMKLPRELRDQVMLVAISDEVLWIPADEVQGQQFGFAGGRYSAKYKVDSETCSIIEITLT